MRKRFSQLMSLAACACGMAVFAAEEPNLILIVADDLGSVDLGCYGTSDLVTPHADALAQRGVRLTQFYCAAPVCSPSRAGTLTGRYPVRAGVPGNCASQKGGQGALPPSEVTMAEMFKAAGNATAHIGKWHLGYTPETMPNSQGFDYSFGHMGGCIDNAGVEAPNYFQGRAFLGAAAGTSPLFVYGDAYLKTARSESPDWPVRTAN
jgi:arylsulfatase A-like enzyme